jgi:hypothetical protein
MVVAARDLGLTKETKHLDSLENTRERAEAQLASHIVHCFKPATVLQASGSDGLAEELVREGVRVTVLNGAPGPHPSARFDMVVCVADGSGFGIDSIPLVQRFSDRIFLVLRNDETAPVVSWLTDFGVCGFVPDITYDSGELRHPALFLQRGPAWPPDALRVFTDWTHLRKKREHLMRLEIELAAERRLTSVLREMQQRSVQEAREPAVFGSMEARLRKIESSLESAKSGPIAALEQRMMQLGQTVEASDIRTRESAVFGRSLEARLGNIESSLESAISRAIAALEQRMMQLCQTVEALDVRTNEILRSRIWTTLVSGGKLVLKITGGRS